MVKNHLRILGRKKMDKKYTDVGLPIIQKETVDSIFSRYSDRGNDWGQFLERTRVKLTEENPELVKYLNGIVGQYPKEMHEPCFRVLMGFYAILNGQLESYKLENILK